MWGPLECNKSLYCPLSGVTSQRHWCSDGAWGVSCSFYLAALFLLKRYTCTSNGRNQSAKLPCSASTLRGSSKITVPAAFLPLRGGAVRMRASRQVARDGC